MQALSGLGGEVVEAFPAPVGVALCLSQGLIGATQHCRALFAGAKGGNTDMGNGIAVTGTGLLQAVQGFAELAGQALCVFAIEAGGKQRELAAAVA